MLGLAQLVINFGRFHAIYDPVFYMVFFVFGLLLIVPAQLYWGLRVSFFPKNQRRKKGKKLTVQCEWSTALAII